ncbi:MAG: hypothetical protein WC335_04705 [Candidatus Omnitrophota bacterium]|jgi:hypothetical protein
MKKGGVITAVILALAVIWCPLRATAQEVAAGGKASYKGVANFYSQRFFSVGQAANTAQAAAQAVEEDATVEVADTGTTETTEITEITDTTETTTTDATTTDTVLETDTQEIAAAGYPAVYDEANGTITYEVNGEQKAINIADIGLSAEWLNQVSQTGGIHSVIENEDGSVKLIVGSDDSGAKKWEYDPSAHLVAHYEGEAGSEKCTVVTSEETYNANYIWASDNAADPGAGPDGHQVVQRFNYDDSGNLATVDYFTWTAGDRQGVDKARYMYRQDTVVSNTSADEEITAECEDTDCCETEVTTKYFNDPFPVDWDPLLTGTVNKDEYGNYWLETGDGNYLLTARVDGFDADKDGKSGADEMNSVDWESLVGQEITVRGHQVNADSEGGVYKDGEKADIFEVVDMITPDEKTSLEDNYQATVDSMQAVADGADPVNEGLVGDNAPGELGFINMFNGQMPTTDQLNDDQQIPRLLGGFSNSGLASFYLNNISTETLAAIREFATPELETALQAAEAARDQANEAATTDATTTDATTTDPTITDETTTDETTTDATTTDATTTDTTNNNAADTQAQTQTIAANTATTDQAAKDAVDALIKRSTLEEWSKTF